MKAKSITPVILIAVAAVMMSCKPADQLRLKVMTFNLKYASETGENKWSDRRPILKRTILAENPDLIGTQEGVYHQLQDMAADLPAYAWLGTGRDGGSRGELMAIFYLKKRFEPLAYDHFWLSDTPRLIGSATWGHTNRRMVTWILFRDKTTGREFYHWNTHLDHRVQVAREKSADLILSEIRRLDPVRPVILTGDFNAAASNVVHAQLLDRTPGQTYLLDAWDIAAERVGEGVGTYNNWGLPPVRTDRIDWILVTPEFQVGRAAVITYQEDGQFPSDHYPVVCDLVLLLELQAK